MFNLQAERYMGLDCLRLSNEVVSLLVTTSLGPRILAFQLKDQENLFVELPEATLDCPGKGSLRMLGGHRLWHSPEQARRTYLPDDQALQVEEIDRGVKLTQPVEQETGIQKSLKLLLPDDSATVVVDHTLNNQGMWPVELAPWAIRLSLLVHCLAACEHYREPEKCCDSGCAEREYQHQNTENW